MNELLKIKIAKDFDGLMIKEILYDHYHFSRKSLAKIKNNKGIFLNGVHVYVTMRVKEGDTLQILVPEETSTDIIPQPIPINIVYEDLDIVVINKPPNIVVHPTKNHFLGTIANGLMYYWQTKGKQYRFRPVHRLDKDTSGLFVVAKNQYSHHKLALQLQTRNLKRIYHAIVHGTVAKEADIIDAPILKDPDHAVKRIVVPKILKEGKPAITFYKTIKRSKDFSLVELELATGRTHQIRVHMSHINHPLVGDDLYGGQKIAGMNRQALHAIKLQFNHPISERFLSFSVPYPEDMQQFISLNVN
ncbi:RluA family pseudouridine synthase [Vulcanibacillus modesticaldus]|nr:RluA family pseudouridine synthase [Vulcanibacillus modesticaldus]